MEVFGLGVRIQEEGSATVAAALKRLQAELQQTATIANNLGGTLGTLTNRTNTVATALRTAGTTSVQSAGLMESSLRKVGAQFAASYLGVQAFINGIRLLVNTSDTMLLLEGRINLVADGLNNLRQLQDKLYASSQLTRTSFSSTAELFARVSRNSDQLGMSQAQLLNFTELTQMSIRTSGINAIEASRGMIQFSQALASGVLRGDEFRAVMEQMPGLSRAIADGLGVPIGALREMANNGELTAEKVIAAITKMEGKIRSDFGKLPVTIGDGMTRVGNALAKGIQDFNDTTGAAESLGNALSSLADVLTKIFDVINNNLSTIKAVGIALSGVLLATFTGAIITAITGFATTISTIAPVFAIIAGRAVVLNGIFALMAPALVGLTAKFTALWAAMSGPLGIAIAAAVGTFAFLNKILDDTDALYEDLDKREDERLRKFLEAKRQEREAEKKTTTLTKEELERRQKLLDDALAVNKARLERLDAERQARFGKMQTAEGRIAAEGFTGVSPLQTGVLEQRQPVMPPVIGKLFDVEAIKSDIAGSLTELAQFIQSKAQENAAIVKQTMIDEFGEGIGTTLQNSIEQGLTGAIMSGRISNLWKAMAQSLVSGLAKVMVDFAIKSQAFGKMMDTINKFLAMGNGLGAVIAASALLAFAYANGGKATMGNTAIAGGAGGMMTGFAAPASPTQQIIFGATSATTAAGMTPRQSMNVTVIGPNDPSAQRAIQELMTKANSRGRIG